MKNNEALGSFSRFKSSVEQATEYIENFDILETINNVGNDEIFTPVKTANRLLDLLPFEVWSNPNLKWLNPCDKNGVFLREIAIRLDFNLTQWQPNKELRRKHILQKMLFSIGLTKFTSQVSRRTLYYCSEANKSFDGLQDEKDSPINGYAIGNGKWFNTKDGNILTPNTEHFFLNGKCKYCGIKEKSKYNNASQIEHYAYEFIHNENIQKHLNARFLKGNESMKFDVIIGNPPYQLSFGIDGGNSSNSQSIYNLFIDQAINLNPKFICMITPSRWMTKTAQGIPEEWVEKMLNDKRVQVVHDFNNAKDCFPNVNIMGGVSYFLWNSEYNGKCSFFFHDSENGTVVERKDYLNSLNSGVVIRDPKAYKILEKIVKIKGNYFDNIDNNFSGYVSPKHYFDDGKLLTSNWKDYSEKHTSKFNIKYYISPSTNESNFGWISYNQIPKGVQTLNINKVFIPAAHGGEKTVLGRPFYGEPGSVGSQTYLVIGYDAQKHNFTKEQCLKLIQYINTKFFRYLVSIKKKTQNGPRGVYQFVPIIDFEEEISDKNLYKYFSLSTDEINIIENAVTIIQKDE